MNKKIVLLIIISLGLLHGDENKEYFLQAKESVKNAHYDQAIEYLKNIENPGVATWYALGNCYWELKDYVRALIVYKSALHHAHISLVSVIYQRVVECQVALGVVPESSWNLYMRMIGALLPLKIFQWLILMLWLFVIGFICFKKNHNKMHYGILGLFLMIIFGGLFVTWYYNALQELIVIESVSIRSGPDECYYPLRILPIGSSLKIKKQQENWYKCSDCEGTGWVQATSVEYVK